MDNNDDIIEYNNSGNYDEVNRKGKKRRIAYYEGDDIDEDGISDTTERRLGIHDKYNNHVKHFNVGGSLRTNSAGIIMFPHQHLTSYQPRKTKGGKTTITMPTPRKVPLSLDIKQPKMSFSIKSIKIPKAELRTENIKSPSHFEDKYINSFLERVGVRRKKRKEGFF